MAALSFDPLTLPIVAVSSDRALRAEEIDAAAVRLAFSAPRSWTPETIAEPSLRTKASAPTPAAVLIGLVQREAGLSVLLTQRTAHLHDHAGQISFPGGRVEPEDVDSVATALRETHEEVGLDAGYIEVLGSLPTYVTGTGFSVVPVVALVRTGFTLKPDDFEVAEVFEVPLSFLMDPSHHETRRASVGELVRHFYTMPYERYFIWGATAGMLRNLYRFLAATP